MQTDPEGSPPSGKAKDKGKGKGKGKEKYIKGICKCVPDYQMCHDHAASECEFGPFIIRCPFGYHVTQKVFNSLPLPILLSEIAQRMEEPPEKPEEITKSASSKRTTDQKSLADDAKPKGKGTKHRSTHSADHQKNRAPKAKTGKRSHKKTKKHEQKNAATRRLRSMNKNEAKKRKLPRRIPTKRVLHRPQKYRQTHTRKS